MKLNACSLILALSLTIAFQFIIVILFVIFNLQYMKESFYQNLLEVAQSSNHGFLWGLLLQGFVHYKDPNWWSAIRLVVSINAVWALKSEGLSCLVMSHSKFKVSHGYLSLFMIVQMNLLIISFLSHPLPQIIVLSNLPYCLITNPKLFSPWLSFSNPVFQGQLLIVVSIFILLLAYFLLNGLLDFQVKEQ